MYVSTIYKVQYKQDLIISIFIFLDERICDKHEMEPILPEKCEATTIQIEPDMNKLEMENYRALNGHSEIDSNSDTVWQAHSALKIRDIHSQNGVPLHKLFQEFETMPFDPKKARKDMKTYEPIFQHICQNLKNHTENDDVTDIFTKAKSLIEKEFNQNILAGNIKIFVRKPFCKQLPQAMAHDNYIESVEKLKALNDINELSLKLQNETYRREKMTKKLMKTKKFIEENKIKLRPLSRKEIQLVKDLPRVKNEKAKMKLFHSIRKYFQHHTDQVLVLMDFKFVGPKASKHKKPFEVDCLLVNLTKKYIMPIVAKTTMNHKSLEKGLKQLEKCNELTIDWLGGDLLNWKLIPAIFFEAKSKNFSGKISHQHIINGIDIDKHLEVMFNEIPSCSRSDQGMAKEDFLMIASYLLFMVSFEPIITPSIKSELEMIAPIKQENIKIVEAFEIHDSSGLRRRKPNWSNCDGPQDLAVVSC